MLEPGSTKTTLKTPQPCSLLNHARYHECPRPSRQDAPAQPRIQKFRLQHQALKPVQRAPVGEGASLA